MVHFDLLPGRDALTPNGFAPSCAAVEACTRRRSPKQSITASAAAPRRRSCTRTRPRAAPRPSRNGRASELDAVAAASSNAGRYGRPERWATKAEVTLGGVDTRALSQHMMEARAVPGLHFIGEVVDVTGWLVATTPSVGLGQRGGVRRGAVGLPTGFAGPPLP